MMISNNFVAACLLGSIGFATAAAVNNSLPVDDSIVKGAYIAELESQDDIQGFLDQIQGEVGNVTKRLDLTYSLFTGVSFHVDGDLPDENGETRMHIMANVPKVKKLWPVLRIPRPQVQVSWTGQDKTFNEMQKRSDSTYAPHTMTQVDKLHERGFTGTGTRIGIVDTGIDYTHPALGGCFGAGCLVSYGADLWDDDEDPLDTCDGHGSHVAGIIAAQTNPLGFVGAAPDATLGAYRIFGCDGGSTTSDMVLAGFNKAFEDGSDIITASLGAFSGWEEDVLAVAVSRIVEAGVPCTVAVGNRQGGTEGVFGPSSPATGRDVFAVTSFENPDTPNYDAGSGTVTMVPNTVDGGYVSVFASWGPNFELEMKPQFGAPGGSILSTYPVALGSYAVLSGTSMATPLAAAIVALVSQARGGILHNTSLMERLLVNTAKPNLISASPIWDPADWTPTDLSLTGPIMQQGGGCLQALDAATATVLLSESNLSFNDSEHFVSEHAFTVTNSGVVPITLNLTHRPAITSYALQDIYRFSSPQPVEVSATLSISPSTLSIGPGETAEIRVQATPPQNLDASSLPVYSGYVALSSSDGTQLSLPYLGVAAAMRNITVMASRRMIFSRTDSYYADPITANSTFQMPLPVGAPKEWLVNATDATTGPDRTDIYAVGALPNAYVWMVMGSSLVRIELVPLDTNTTMVKDGLVGSGISGAPLKYQRPIGWFSAVDGTLADGSIAPPGLYKCVITALRTFGDVENVDDYDRFDSVPFWIRYVDTTAQRPRAEPFVTS